MRVETATSKHGIRQAALAVLLTFDDGVSI